MENYYGYQPDFTYYKNRQENVRAFAENPTLSSREEGYIRGNMFKDTYIPYKNYQPQVLRATNEQEELFLNMSANAFAAHDLNLYLDLHPQDGNALDLFNQYRVETNKKLTEYEDNFGPITLSSNTLTGSPFMWVAKPFPWNEGGM